MCDLTTKWILESAHCFSVCTYIYFIFTFYVGELDAQKGAVCSRFKVQGSLLFVTYTIIQGIIGSEMLVRTGPLNGKCKKEK